MTFAIMRRLLARLRALVRSSGHEQDLDDELRAYVDALAEQHERRGLAPAAARRAALVDVGGVEQVKETVREVRMGFALTTAMRDARYGSRVLWRSPSYALVVILTIALGIGINVAMFSVIHAVLWRSLPYPDASRIVTIEADTQGIPSAYASSDAVFDPQQSHLVTHIAAVGGRDASITLDGVMESVAAARVSEDLLPTLGVTPLALGRSLVDSLDARDVYVRGVVVSYEFWQRRFQGDVDVIGRHLTVNNQDVQVVGVTRPNFRVYLPPADHVEERIDVWLPRRFEPTTLYRGAVLVGRLAPGTTVAQAQVEVDALAAAFAAQHPDRYPAKPVHLSIRPLSDVVTRDAKPALMALAVAVAFVLLIACANVANLMLARAKTRERELAVRRALGATRFRLVRQLLAENLVFTVLGGACGLLLARGGVGILDWLRPVHLPRQSEITIDAVVVLWTAGLTVASSVLFGLAPALFFTGDSLGQPLNSGRAGSTMMRSRAVQRGLVVAEVALSIVPLLAAGLMLRTFANLLQAPIGFDPSHVVTARVSLSLTAFPEVDRRSAFLREAIARVSELPGVDAVSVGGPLPFAPARVTQRYWRRDDVNPTPSIGFQQTIMPGYLKVMGIPLRAGRDLTDDDISHQHPVAIVDEQLAAQLWRGDALGKRLAIGETGTLVLEVVGIAAPIRISRVRDQSTPTIYVPYHVYEIEENLVVKTATPAAVIGPAIKRTVESLGPGRPVFDIRPMSEIIAASIDETRFTMLVLGGFALAALLLAGVGLYGTLAYLISQRTQEFGVRLALGASAASVVRLVAREGGVLTGLGGAIGLAAAAGVARVLRSLLYGVTPLDGATIASVAALVALVAMVAVGRPAWRAARVDPVKALHGD
jgi:putative ABC transport system permease protein